MLVLTRRVGEQIELPDSGVTITVVSVAGNRVRLGVTAPATVAIYRKEVLQRAGLADIPSLEGHSARGFGAAVGGRGRDSVEGASTSTATQDLESQLTSAIAGRTGTSMKLLRVRILGDRIVVEGCANSYDTIRLANLALLEALTRIDADWPEEIEMEVEVDPPALSALPLMNRAEVPPPLAASGKDNMKSGGRSLEKREPTAV